jgi:hypothetical protein
MGILGVVNICSGTEINIMLSSKYFVIKVSLLCIESRSKTLRTSVS